MASIYNLTSSYDPAGDQPDVIDKVTKWLNDGESDMTIHGITGSGKTFTMANIIANINRPALIYSPNKILAYQLYEEMRAFFPENKVHYYVSSFDFYLPEFVKEGEYHPKQSQKNDILEQMILETNNSLISDARDLIIIASSSCLYGTGSPEMYRSATINIDINNSISLIELKNLLTHAGYVPGLRNTPTRGEYIENGNRLIICSSEYENVRTLWSIRVDSEGVLDRIVRSEEDISTLEVLKKETNLMHARIFPATRFAHGVYTSEDLEKIANNMRKELAKQKGYLTPEKHNFLTRKLEDDISSIMNYGYCNGIENYSWYFNRNNLDKEYTDSEYLTSSPYTLMSYLPKDTVVFIDESHLALGQIAGCSAADYKRKADLVAEGIRLPSCRVNRPLKKLEFSNLDFQKCYVSATPREEELNKSQDRIANLFIRPTYLVDPDIKIIDFDTLKSKKLSMFDSIIHEIKDAKKKGNAVLLRCSNTGISHSYATRLGEYGIIAEAMLADNTAQERREMVERLQGENPNLKPLDVIVGVNLIREGLDIPRVSKVIISSIDSGGFLNDTTSLIQVIGRAARNKDGKVLIYVADRDDIKPPVQKAIKETLDRRNKQLEYNKKYNKIPITTVANSYLHKNKMLEIIENTYINNFDDVDENKED